jgi:TonB family protein
MLSRFLLLLFMASFGSAQDRIHRVAVEQPTPAYPELARKMNLSGSVKIEIVVAPDGTVKSTKVVGGNPVLAASAEKTVKTWKYGASKEETAGTITVNFGSNVN